MEFSTQEAGQGAAENTRLSRPCNSKPRWTENNLHTHPWLKDRESAGKAEGTHSRK